MMTLYKALDQGIDKASMGDNEDATSLNASGLYDELGVPPTKSPFKKNIVRFRCRVLVDVCGPFFGICLSLEDSEMLYIWRV